MESSSGWIRRKGNIGGLGLTLLVAIGCLPLILVLVRVVALPGGPELPVSGANGFGEWLNATLSLEWIPPADRSAILYLILLPASALLVAVTRLTFGIRVLGLRAILIAIGFQESGLIPSLALMAVIVGIIVVIRPTIRRIKLPMYARIAVILSLSAMIMVAALMIAPWLRSEAVWSVAFFPVIIMAMMAEGIAKTLEQDDWVVAAWRAVWTIVLAIVIALVNPLIGGIAIRFPELILTQLVAIVFVAEFFDLRLLDAWPARLSRFVNGVRPWYTDKPKVAVVRNRVSDGVIGRLGPQAPARYAKTKVQRQVSALRGQGYRVKVIAGDMDLLRGIRRFIPPDPRRGTPGGIVLNLSTGVQGKGRFTQVPAMLELAGVPYTGPDPESMARLSDRMLLLTMLREAGLPAPVFRVIAEEEEIPELEGPVALRARFEPDGSVRVVRKPENLERIVGEIRAEYGQPVVAEEWAGGREIRVSLLGNQTLECLPLMEYVAGERTKLCPAPLEPAQTENIRALACSAFRAAGCRDYARVDIRISDLGVLSIDDVVWTGLLAQRGSMMTSAAQAGYGYGDLLQRIVEVAAARWSPLPEQPPKEREPDDSTVVSLADRRAGAK